MNTNNFAISTGRLTKNPIVMENKDGSKKVLITVAAQDNYKGKDGKRGSQFIPLEGFVPSGKALGVYEKMHQGDQITAQYTVKNNNYTDKSGEEVYGLTLQIESVTLLESKSVTDARQANRVANEADAAANAEAEAEA